MVKDAVTACTESPPPFQSLLAIPIAIESDEDETGCWGLLYVGSVAVQGFNNQVLLDAAQLEATLLGGMLSRHVLPEVTSGRTGSASAPRRSG
jgi:hypothetical protein